MTVSAAVWCLACGAPPDVALTIERHHVLAHYGACWAHVVTVAQRARDDVQAADARAAGGPWLAAAGQPAVEVQGRGPRA
jgi:hypothetical protein